MQNKKNIIFFIGLGFYIYLLTRLYPNDWLILYRGVQYEAKLYFILITFFEMACLSFYLFHDFEDVKTSYAIYLVTRKLKRSYLFQFLQIYVLKKILLFQIMKILLFILIIYIQGIQLMATPLEEFILMLIISTMFDVVMMNVQMGLELKLNSKTAIIIVLSYYLIGLYFGTVFFINDISIYLQVLILPGLHMFARIQQLALSLNSVLIILLCYISIVTFVNYRMIRKLDFI